MNRHKSWSMIMFVLLLAGLLFPSAGLPQVAAQEQSGATAVASDKGIDRIAGRQARERTLPDEAEARLERLPLEDWASAPELIKKVEGVRVGPGLRKIVAGLLGGPRGCPLLVHAVLEASNAVILHFTRPGLQAAEAIEADALIAATREMLKQNPRLLRSCVAFQDDSPIVQGLDL